MTTKPLHKRAHQRSIDLVRAERARRDINEFCQFVMRDPQGKEWVQQPFHQEWQALVPVRGRARVLIGSARESAKSSQLAVARPLWELGNNPELRIKIICASEDLATKLSGEIARHIEHNPRLHLVFPHLRPDPNGPWTRTQLRVVRSGLSKDPSIEAYGIISAGVGGRADLLIFDDVCDQRTAVLQPAMRQQIKQLFYETWINLLGPDGRAVYIATVWHPADLSVELRDSGNWTTWWRGIYDEATGESLWPDRWGPEALRQREAEIGSRAFARQFRLEAVSDEERLFSPQGIARCRDTRYVVGRQQPDPSWPRFMGVDLAASLGKKASYSAIFVVAVSPQGQLLPVEIIRARLKLADLLTAIVQTDERWKPERIVVENNAFQEAVLELLRRDHPKLPLFGHRTGSEKADEQIGLPSLAAAVDRGEWIIPAGGVPHGGGCECAYCAWQREMALYPACEHSDTLMAMWFADLAAREGLKAYQKAQASLLPPSQPSIPGWRSTASELRAMSSVPTGRNWGCPNSWEERLARARRVETPENSRSR